ncbi:MAG: hypothetical protein QG602_3648 [Verrucomicrobiota bacterium]|nr:hypothetical protein [Verrucomicrobiota bacterium]
MKKASSAETVSSSASSVGATVVAPGAKSRASTPPPSGSLSLWLWVAAGFLFLAGLWTALFLASRRIDTRTVPLATQEAKP